MGNIERRDDELYDFGGIRVNEVGVVVPVWHDEALRNHAKQLVMDKEVAFGHAAEEMDRRLGNVAFELWYRAHWEPQHADVRELEQIELSA